MVVHDHESGDMEAAVLYEEQPHASQHAHAHAVDVQLDNQAHGYYAQMHAHEEDMESTDGGEGQTRMKPVFAQRPRLIKCDYCSKTFTKASHVVAHIRTHTGEKPWFCEVCSRGFASRESLQYHTFRFHNDDPGQPMHMIYEVDPAGNIVCEQIREFKCHICDKSFCVRRALERHVFTHTTHKPFKCDQCVQSYKYKTSLDTHRKVEHGIGRDFDTERQRPGFNVLANRFECERCHRQFKWRKSLINHVGSDKCMSQAYEQTFMHSEDGTPNHDVVTISAQKALRNKLSKSKTAHGHSVRAQQSTADNHIDSNQSALSMNVADQSVSVHAEQQAQYEMLIDDGHTQIEYEEEVDVLQDDQMPSKEMTVDGEIVSVSETEANSNAVSAHCHTLLQHINADTDGQAHSHENHNHSVVMSASVEVDTFLTETVNGQPEVSTNQLIAVPNSNTNTKQTLNKAQMKHFASAPLSAPGPSTIVASAPAVRRSARTPRPTDKIVQSQGSQLQKGTLSEKSAKKKLSTTN